MPHPNKDIPIIVLVNGIWVILSANIRHCIAVLIVISDIGRDIMTTLIIQHLSNGSGVLIYVVIWMWPLIYMVRYVKKMSDYLSHKV